MGYSPSRIDADDIIGAIFAIMMLCIILVGPAILFVDYRRDVAREDACVKACEPQLTIECKKLGELRVAEATCIQEENSTRKVYTRY